MYKYIVKKTIRAFLLVLAVSLLAFIFVKLSPIDPVRASIDSDASLAPEQYKALAEYWGVNEHPVKQYCYWLKNILSGDMGDSKIYNQSVASIIKEKAYTSFWLMSSAWVFSGIVGFLLGSLSAFKKGTFLDVVIRFFSYLQSSVPSFWLGLLMLMIFSVHLGWFPIGVSSPIGIDKGSASFADKLSHLILPVMTLSFIGIANITLHTREKMIGVLASEYILFARARGESELQIFKNHAFRNSILPALTIHFAYFGDIFAGSVLVEQVFSYPGLGFTLTEAGLRGDIPLLLGIVVVTSVFVFTGNMIADILASVINPRILEGGSNA